MRLTDNNWDKQPFKDSPPMEPDRCEECGVAYVNAVYIGEFNSIESHSNAIDLCLPCLKKAVALLEEKEGTPNVSSV